MPVQAYFELASVVVLFATLVVAAVTDLLHRKVYNWLTIPAALLGLALAYLAHGVGSFDPAAIGGVGLLDRLAGLTLGFGVFWVAYFGRGVGGGDVKLMGAIGAIAGFRFVVFAMFWSALLGAVIAVWVLVARGDLVSALRRSLRYAVSIRREPSPATATAPTSAGGPAARPASSSGKGPQPDDPAQLSIPYGVAISFGTLLAWFLVEAPRA